MCWKSVFIRFAMSVIQLTCLLFLLVAPTYCLDTDMDMDTDTDTDTDTDMDTDTDDDSESKLGHFYASVSSLGHLLEFEKQMLQNLKHFIHRELDKHQQINLILERFEKENKSALKKPGEYFNSPINVFRTIKRSIVNLRNLEGNMVQRSNSADYELNLTRIATTLNVEWPNSDDLRGAVFGLERLQKTYELSATDLSGGRLLGVQVSAAMSFADAFVIGKELFDAERFQRSFEWFSVAWTKVTNQSSSELQTIDEVTILDVFSSAAYKAGKLEIALDLTKQLLSLDPANARGQANLKIVQTDIFNERNARKPQSNAKVVKPFLPFIYEATCRGELKQSPTEKRPLRCMYVNNNVPFLKIAPFKMEQLSLDPSVAYFHESIYDSEIEQILKASNTGLIPSELGDVNQRKVSISRTSKNAFLEWDEHNFLDSIRQRLFDMTQLSMDTSEVPQVVNYGIGGHYYVHYDFARDSNEMFEGWDGNRIATALFYISDVELGGATAFPRLKLAVKPIKRSMLIWYNLHNSTDPDYRTLHAGCPVLKGSKWIFIELMHTGGQEFRKPCGLQSTAYLSKEYKL